MANVPNTTTFAFTDVTTSVYGDNAAGRELSGSFGSAVSIGFDGAYSGSKNSQLNFRNYQPSLADGAYFYLAYGQNLAWSIDRASTFSIKRSDPAYKIAVSSTGQYVTITALCMFSPWYGTRLCTSSDYGSTWTVYVTTPGSELDALTMDPTGQYQYWNSYSYGYKISSDYGASWSTPGKFSSGGRWVSASSNGQYIIARGINYPFISTNYGSSFSQLFTTLCNMSCMSYTGKYMMLSYEGGVKLSSNYGASWSNMLTQTPMENYMGAIAISGTGQYQLAGSAGTWDPDLGDYNSFASLMVSSNYGASWTVIYSNLYYTVRWVCAEMSYDGKYQVVGTGGAGVWVSTNYGVSFTQKTNGGSSPTTTIGINRFLTY